MNIKEIKARYDQAQEVLIADRNKKQESFEIEVEWCISRVEELEKALDAVRNEALTRYGGGLDAADLQLEDIAEMARKALEEKS